MLIAAVMDEMAGKLTRGGIRVKPWEADSVVPPMAIIPMPDIDYSETYARGADKISIEVVMMVGRLSDRASRDQHSVYADGSGDTSIVALLNSSDTNRYSTCDSVTVMRCEPTSFTIAGIDYLAGTFHIDIVGKGA